MVKGKSQVVRNQPNKRNSAAATCKQTTASSSPAQSSNKVKPSKQSLMTCCGCEAVITDDMKALQCDRCQMPEAWKCVDCLNIPADMYDHLVSDPTCSLRWFCNKCDKVTMDLDRKSPDKIDTLVNLVEKLLEKLSAVDSQMKDKCDTETVIQLEAKVKSLESCLEQREREHEDNLLMLEQKIMSYLEERTCKQSANNQNIGTGEVTQCVADEVAKRIERDNDIEKRKKI